MNTPRDYALAAIGQANLQPTTERNARRLLAVASDDNGHITLSPDGLCDLFGVGNFRAAIKHLTHLQSIQVLHYSTNGDVYITFRTWSPANAEGVGDEAIARGRAEIARGRAIEGGLKGGRERERESSLTPLPEKNSLTLSLPDAEQKRSLAVLTDPTVGMSRFSAERLAAQHPFEVIRAFACRWADEGREPVKEAGLIAYRLEAAEVVPPLSRNELWQRHRTAGEIAEDEKRQAEAAEENRRWEAEQAQCQAERVAAQSAPSPAPASQPEAVEIWAQVLSQLAFELPAPTYEQWVRDTDLIGVDDGTYTVGVPHAYARDWLENRLKTNVQRTLSRLLNRSIQVSFAVRPRPTPTGGRTE